MRNLLLMYDSLVVIQNLQFDVSRTCGSVQERDDGAVIGYLGKRERRFTIWILTRVGEMQGLQDWAYLDGRICAVREQELDHLFTASIGSQVQWGEALGGVSCKRASE